MIRCCHGCEKRTVGCHASCEDYIREDAERKKMLEARKNYFAIDNMYQDVCVSGSRKAHDKFIRHHTVRGKRK